MVPRSIARGSAASTPSRKSRCPGDSPLRKLGDKVLISPHAASFNEDGELRPGIAWATRSVIAALNGRVPDNVYNKDVLPRWKERFGGASVTEGG